MMDDLGVSLREENQEMAKVDGLSGKERLKWRLSHSSADTSGFPPNHI